MAKNKVRPSKNQLDELYNKEKLTLREIGKKYNVTKTTIKRWFNEYDLKVRSDPQEARLAKREVSLPTKVQLEEDYKTLSLELIAKKYNVSTEPILTLLNKYNIKKRNRSESRKLSVETKRSISWNKGKGVGDPRVAEMMQNLHKKQMEKMPQIKIKVSETKKRLFSEGKLKSWNKGKIGIYSEETKNKIRVARLRQRPTQKNTKPEKLMRLLLEKNNLTEGLVEQYGLKIGKIFTIPDFAYPEYKIAIYCDGDFWHGGFHYFKGKFEDMKEGPIKEGIKKTMKKDEKIHYVLWANGWSVLRFWEHIIAKNPEEIIDQIKKNLFDKEFIKKREEGRKEYTKFLKQHPPQI